MIKRILVPFAGLLLVAVFLVPFSHVSAASHVQMRPYSNFADTCTNLDIMGDGLLSADCLTIDGLFLITNLDLDLYVGNIDGVLTANSSGFMASCTIYAGNNGSVMRADCFTISGNYVFSSLDLNPFISNDNGHLVWG